MSTKRIETEIDGRRVSLSNLDKVLFPATGFTKGELIDYYARIADVMAPHVAQRALTLRRYPDGVDGQVFFEKHVPSHAPDWIETVRVPAGYSERGGKPHEEIVYAVVNDRAGLVWAANLATIEFHVPLWHNDGSPPPAPPDHLVFDLDPGEGTTIVDCCRVATFIREGATDASLGPLVAKTSGSKGLQLYAPLATPKTWDEARALALDLAQRVERRHGDLVVTNMRKELRKGRVLIDWSQNHPAKTTVAVYSVRGRPEPTVSTPVTTEEVDDCLRSSDPKRLVFTTRQVLERVETYGDLFAPLVGTQRPKATRRGGKASG